MARAPKTTSIATYDEQLAAAAAQYASMEASTATGDFFGLKSGVLTWGGNPVKNNEVACIILDSVLENIYYEGTFEADTPQAPMCFAYSRTEEELAPHETVVKAGQAQANMCSECQYNEWGSAHTGKGKACRNTRRLALLPAGEFDRDGEFLPIEDAEQLFGGSVGFMKLPVTSVKNFANYVKQIGATFKRPPFAVFTKISVEPDTKTQFKVVFEALGLLDNDFIPMAIDKHEEATGTIEFPYQLSSAEDEEAPAAKKKPARKVSRKY